MGLFYANLQQPLSLGEVKLLPWADSPEFLLQFDTLWIGGRAYRVESSRVQKTCVLVKLAGIDTVTT